MKITLARVLAHKISPVHAGQGEAEERGGLLQMGGWQFYSAKEITYKASLGGHRGVNVPIHPPES